MYPDYHSYWKEDCSNQNKYVWNNYCMQGFVHCSLSPSKKHRKLWELSHRCSITYLKSVNYYMVILGYRT